MTKFKTTIELDVEVVGHFTGATRATRDEPGSPEEFEIEAVLLTMPITDTINKQIDIMGALSESDLEDLQQTGIEQARESLESDWLEAQIASAEARRDAKEDR